MNHEKLWSSVLDAIKQNISDASFQTWFQDLEVQNLKNNKLTIKVQSEFQKDWIIKRYSNLVNECIDNLSNETIEVIFTSNLEDKALEKDTFTTTLKEYENGIWVIIPPDLVGKYNLEANSEVEIKKVGDRILIESMEEK